MNGFNIRDTQFTLL